MRPRPLASFLLAVVTIPSLVACGPVRRMFGGGGGTGSTSPYGHWVLATPIDSTAFAGATQVELILDPRTFSLTAAYPDRPTLEIGGRAELAEGGLLTLVPGAGEVSGSAVGFTPGQPFTRMASAAGATLILAPPTSRVPVPSSVWHRLDVARAAGLAR